MQPYLPDDEDISGPLVPMMAQQAPPPTLAGLAQPAPAPQGDQPNFFSKLFGLSDGSSAPGSSALPSVKDLQDQQASADKKRQYLGVIGSALQNFQDIPSAHEMLYHGKGYHSDVKGMMNQLAGSIQNPMDQQAKAMAYLKAQRDERMGQDEDASIANEKKVDSSESKALRQLAPRWGIQVTPDMTAYDIKKMINPQRMMQTEAESHVNFENQKALKQLELQNDLKKFGIEHSGDKAAKAQAEYDKHAQEKERQAISLRGDDAAKLSSAKLSAISSGRALINKYKGRENEMPPSDLALLAADRVKSVTGGQPTETEMEHMTPSNGGTMWSNVKSKFTRKPEPANSGEWVKDADADFKVQEQAARAILKNRQDQITNDPKLRPEDRERIGKMAVPPEFDQPPGGAPEMIPASKAAPKMPTVGEVRDGHRFKGGNPADPRSWEEVNPNTAAQ